MKKIYVVFMIVLFSIVSVSAQISGKQLLKKIDSTESYKSNYSEMKQIITTSSGRKRTLVIRGWAVNNGDKQLSEYISPADIKGQKILMTDDGDNIWMYNPETRRTRKLGSHMKKRKVMGSDFTYEDQSMTTNMSKKFRAVNISTEKFMGDDCYVFDAIPNKNGPDYKKLRIWVGKEDFVTRKVDFYEEASKPYKRLIMEDIYKEGGKIIPHKMTMKSLDDGTETVNIITKIRFGVKIPLSIFASRNLGR